MTTYTNNFNFPKPAFAASNWHTDMYAFMDSVDALFETFLSVADMTGPWQNSTAYTVGQVALDTTVGGLYECLVGHTSASTGTFSADRSSNPTYWQVSSYSARALAEKWADEEEDVEVETGKYSAKHWATKAAAIVGAFGGTAILDADSDTFVKTEASADEDKVRINTAGVQRVVVDASGLDATTLLEGGTALSSKYAAIAHVSDTANPHSVTKTQVGLANVTNDAQLKIASNLADITNAATARGNLGLGSVAVLNSIDTANLADNAVSLAKIASGTAGDSLIWNASGDPAALAAGTTGQVLTMGATVPGWEDNTASIEFVDAVAVSGDPAAVEFTDLSTGYDHIFVLDNVGPATDSVTLYLRTSPDTGGTPVFDNGASDYEWTLQRQDSTAGTMNVNADPNDSEVHLIDSVMGNVSTEVLHGLVEIINPGASGVYQRGFMNAVYGDTSGGQQRSSGAFTRQATGVVSAVQFLWSSGNFANTGSIRHYRRKTS